MNFLFKVKQDFLNGRYTFKGTNQPEWRGNEQELMAYITYCWYKDTYDTRLGEIRTFIPLCDKDRTIKVRNMICAATLLGKAKYEIFSELDSVFNNKILNKSTKSTMIQYLKENKFDMTFIRLDKKFLKKHCLEVQRVRKFTDKPIEYMGNDKYVFADYKGFGFK